MVPTSRRPRLPTPPQSSQYFPASPGRGEQTGKRHLLEGKSSRVTRRMTGTVEVAKADRKRVKKMLGR